MAIASSSLYFNGTNGYINVGTFNVFNGSNDQTFLFWLNFNNINKESNPISADFTNNVFNVRIRLSGGKGYLFFQIFSPDGSTSNRLYNNALENIISTGEWHFFQITYKTRNTWILKIDDTIYSLATLSDATSDAIKNISNEYYIGQWTNFASSTYLDGNMSYVQLYNRALSDAEIQEIRWSPEITYANCVSYCRLINTTEKDLARETAITYNNMTTSVDGSPVANLFASCQ